MIGRMAAVRLLCFGGLVAPLLLWRGDGGARLTRRALGAIAIGQVAWVVGLFFNHLPYPFLLDLMEGTVLQHAARLASGLPVYPAPTPEFVPLAYNPLYYVLSAPLLGLFGATLPVMRAVAIGGYVASALGLFAIARRATGSRWVAVMVVGLFAAAYRAMDAYLDTAHSDSWMLAAVIWGTVLLDEARSWQGRLAAMLLFVAGFWFKQHGALFALVAAAHIALCHGWRAALPPVLLAAALGPGLYLLLGRELFGSHFHFYTLAVPAGWSEFNWAAARRVMQFFARWYAVLVASTCWGALAFAVRRSPSEVPAWQSMLVPAVASAFMGAMDPWSSDNVFIPLGTWLILCGGIALAKSALGEPRRGRAALAGLVISLVLLLYDPRTVLLRPEVAREQVRDLQRTIDSLAHPVYAPMYGVLPGVTGLSPTAHWVALEDMVRGPRHPASGAASVAAALAPLVAAAPLEQYVLAYDSLRSSDLVLGSLLGRYPLVHDFGARWGQLRFLPKRWADSYGQPRFLRRTGPPPPP